MDSPSRPVVPDPGTPVGPESARADRINLGSTNKAVMKGDLNSILSNRRKDKAKEAFQALKGRTTSIPS